MKSAFEELILQNSLYMESIKYGETYNQALRERDKNYKNLVKTLTKEQAELLENLVNSHIRLEAEASDCNLFEGFKAAIRLMMECLQNRNLPSDCL